jgi:hypothetical protein
MLFVCAVGIGLIPTVTSSMPEKGRYAIVERYGDCATTLRKSPPAKMEKYGELVGTVSSASAVAHHPGWMGYGWGTSPFSTAQVLICLRD